MSETTDPFRRAFDAAADGDLDTLQSVFAAHPELAKDDRILEESAGDNRPEITQMILDAGATVQGTGEHYLVYAVALHMQTKPPGNGRKFVTRKPTRQNAADIPLPNRLWRVIDTLHTTGADIYGAAMEQM